VSLSLYDLTPAVLRVLDDRDVEHLDARAHKVWSNDVKNGANDHRIGKLLSALARSHAMIVKELRRRGLQHENREDGLDELSKVTTPLGEVLSVPVGIEGLPAIRVTAEEGAQIADGRFDSFALPDTPKALSLVGMGQGVKAVLIAGGFATGRLTLSAESREVPMERIGERTLDLEGPGEPRRVVGFSFDPFLVPVKAEAEIEGSIFRPGEVSFSGVPQVKAIHQLPTRDVTPKLLMMLSDRTLETLDTILHSRHKRFEEEGKESEDLVNAHRFVIDEMKRRKLQHEEAGDALDRATAELSKEAVLHGAPTPTVDEERLRALHKELPESIVVTPEFVSLTGSFVYPHKDGSPPRDIDVVYRANSEALGLGGLALKLERAFKALVGPVPLQHIAEPTGPCWTFAPLYDLVLVKRPFGVEPVHEDFARFIKAAVTPKQAFEFAKPGMEFYSAQPLRVLMDRWGAKALEAGAVYIQPKADGFSMAILKDGNEVKILTESGRNRADLFPGIVLWARRFDDDFVLMGEFVPLEDGDPVPRQEGIWTIVANERPEGASVRVFLHDLLYRGERSLSGEPYSERWAELNQLFGKASKAGDDEIEMIENRIAEDESELMVAVREMAKELTSEGAILKRADWIYEPGKAQTQWAKFKNLVEYDAVIIGARKVPAGREPGRRLSREEALGALPQQTKESQTWVLRIAVKGPDGKLIPIEADRVLGPADLELDWDEARQSYRGTDDPKLWSPPFGFTCPGFENREEGETAYGVTFAVKLVEPPECGLVVTVAPAAFQVFEREDGSKGYAHTFPRVTGLKIDQRTPGRIEDILEAFRRLRPEALAKELCDV
jgi:hypothetical protein